MVDPGAPVRGRVGRSWCWYQWAVGSKLTPPSTTSAGRPSARRLRAMTVVMRVPASSMSARPDSTRMSGESSGSSAPSPSAMAAA